MMTGSDPADIIDHEDTDRLNNRWRNLREAANGPNIQNSKLRRDNSSGVKGVHWDARHKKWRAVLTTNGVSVRLGRYASINEAASVIASARMRDHAEFARMA
ncbi:HNH endonuclease [Bradyrhizobium tropiciagri]|uniref:HNH endonuclease n=1 Tax=Bradyrhizobium tropiciagri TaxID=312253 RepID=UPI001BA53FB5|nr:AP2 domain-containing protein [Bradyrhizobium tropiciagri]MBR0868931.1 HNH endonuclease [Bradyrhizobium tropiciagri]